jgi:hypothetical protein
MQLFHAGALSLALEGSVGHVLCWQIPCLQDMLRILLYYYNYYLMLSAAESCTMYYSAAQCLPSQAVTMLILS